MGFQSHSKIDCSHENTKSQTISEGLEGVLVDPPPIQIPFQILKSRAAERLSHLFRTTLCSFNLALQNLFSRPLTIPNALLCIYFNL